MRLQFDDVPLRQPSRSGRYRVPRDEVIEYARKWDPQPWHLDDEAAAQTHFGRISACFSHVFAIVSKLITDRDEKLDLVAGLGFEECMLTHPVYPDDVLTVEVEYVEKRASRTKPDRGILTMRLALINQDGVEVFAGLGRTMVARDPEAAIRAEAPS